MSGFLEGGAVFAFGLTLLAGLSTGLGSLAALLTHRTNKAFLCAALGFSAGVMVYVSTIEIYAKARLALTGALGLRAGSWATAGAFFAGILTWVAWNILRTLDDRMNSFLMCHAWKSLDLIICHISFIQKVHGNVDAFLCFFNEFSSVLWCKHSLTQSIELTFQFINPCISFFLIACNTLCFFILISGFSFARLPISSSSSG